MTLIADPFDERIALIIVRESVDSGYPTWRKHQAMLKLLKKVSSLVQPLLLEEKFKSDWMIRKEHSLALSILLLLVDWINGNYSKLKSAK